jgi:hypothetical protein
MTLKSPTREGFRAAFRLLSLTFAEITWRWTVGAVGWTLFVFSFVEYLDTVPVSRADVTLLGTRQPFLVGKAISHILRGSLDRAVFATLFAGLSLILLWMVAAAIGRVAIVGALLDHFRGDVATGDSSEPENRSSRLCSLLALNFLRLVVALAAILAFAGAAIVASFASPDANPRSGLAFVLFLPLAAAICMVWPALNWLLSLASVFVIRDADDTLAGISSAITFFREHLGSVFAVTIWTGLAHLVAFSVASTVASMLLAFLQFLPARFIISAILLLTLVYFAVVDWLYIARLAGYVCIAEMPDALVLIAPSFDSPLRSPDAAAQSAIDRDEPILSDLPNLVPNT